MSVEALTAFIAEYIAARRQTKLEAFDKKTAKSNADDNIDIAEKRREKELCYEPNTWLTAAANRAWQIFFLLLMQRNIHMEILRAVVFIP